jgi:hypothetical protein
LLLPFIDIDHGIDRLKRLKRLLINHLHHLNGSTGSTGSTGPDLGQTGSEGSTQTRIWLEKKITFSRSNYKLVGDQNGDVMSPGRDWPHG